MKGWLSERDCRGSGGWGVGHWDSKLTQSDNGRRQPACQVSSRSVLPFCRNSRFCPIRGKNAGVGQFSGTFREDKVNCRQLRLARWVGEGWGYHTEETRRCYLFWSEHNPRVSQTDRQTCLQQRPATLAFRGSKKFLIFKIRCLSISEKI